MNGYDAQDMASQGADGFRNGYQAGYADAVKAIEAAQPAAAQEAVGEVSEWDGSLCVQWVPNYEPPVGAKLYAAPVTAAPTLDDELAQDRMSELCKLESDVLDVLPSVYYMDPPDGGDVSLGEQVKRMAEDAANWRKHASTPAAPGIDLAALRARVVSAVERITSGAASMRIPADMTDPDLVLGDVLTLLDTIAPQIDASPKCAFSLASVRVPKEKLWADGDSDFLRGHADGYNTAISDVISLNSCVSKIEQDSPKGGSEARDAVLTELVEAISAFKGKRGAFMALGAQDARTIRLWSALAKAQASDAEVRRG